VRIAAPIGAAYVLIHAHLARRWRTRRSAAGG
jgi:hypothetical protein